VAFSPNGKTLASGGTDGVCLWDVATSKKQAVFHGDFVLSIAFSPDGRTLAASILPKDQEAYQVALLDVKRGTERGVLKGYTDEGIICLAFTPDGRMLATACGDFYVGRPSDISVDDRRKKGEVRLWWFEEKPKAESTEQGKMAEEPFRKADSQPRIAKQAGYLELQSVDLNKRTIKVIEGKSKLGEGWIILNSAANVALSVGPTTKITIDGKEAQLAALQTDHAIWVDIEWENEALDGKIKGGKAIRIEANGEKIEGVAQAINTNKNTITITRTDHEAKGNVNAIHLTGTDYHAKGNVVQATYVIAKDAEVAINGKKATFSDMKAQMPVSLQMSAVKQALVVRITALGPKVQGVVKSVNADKRTISVNILGANLIAEAVPVVGDAKVVIDGAVGKLSELKAGMRVTLQMSGEPEQSLVIGITKEAMKK